MMFRIFSGVFGELSAQNFCTLKIVIFLLFTCFVCFRYKTFTHIGQIFSQLKKFIFYILSVVFHDILFNFNKIQTIFWKLLFGAIFEHRPNRRWHLVYFLTMVLQFWILTFRSILCQFLWKMWSLPMFLFLYMDIWLFQHNLKNRLSFSLGLLFDSLSKINQLTIFVWVYFGAPFFYTVEFLSFLLPILSCLGCYGLMLSPEIGENVFFYQ